MFKLIKTLFVIIALLFVYNTSYSQVSSYYSINAMGMPVSNNNIRSMAMGGVYNSLIDQHLINYNNPASYGAFTLTNFAISASFISNYIANKDTGGRINTASFNALAIGFPLKANKIGLAIGLHPYSYVNYNAFTSEMLNEDKVNIGMKGNGSYSTAFIGLGFNIIKDLMFGFNINYLFGNIGKSKYLYFNAPNVYNSKSFIDVYASGFFLNYGLAYNLNLSSKDKLILSYSSDIASKINTKEDLISGSYIDINDNEVIIDTVSSAVNNKNSFILPFKHTIGAMYEIQQLLRVGIDLYLQNWNNIKYKPFDEVASSLMYLKNQQLTDSYRLSLGAEYVPNIQSSAKYYEKVEYRAGIKLEKLNVNVNNNGVYAISVTTGLGLPINKQLFSASIYDLSYLNIGIGLTKQGSISKNLVSETYFSVYLGFNIANKWFIQRKYD